MAEPKKTTTKVNNISPSMAARLQEAGRVASASMQKVAPLDMNKLNKAVAKAEEQTDWNYHDDSRLTLSKFFKYDDLTKEYNNIKKEHLAAHSLTQELYDRRNAADRKFYERVREQYGEDVLRKVRSGL